MRQPKTPYVATPEELAAIDEARAERNPAFTEAEWSTLVELLTATIAADRYPLSPRIKMLTSILSKIEAPVLRTEPVPPPKAPGEPSLAQRRKRRRS